jgi:hypothetical protein
MRVVFLVGNGFDISLNLKTDAGTLIKGFCNKYLPKQGKDAANPNEELALAINEQGISAWSDFEKKFGEYSASVKGGKASENYVEAHTGFCEYLYGVLEKREKVFEGSDVLIENAGPCIKSMMDLADILPTTQSDVVRALISKHGSEHVTFEILSFNYTKSFDALFSNVKQSSSQIGLVDGRSRAYLLGDVYHPHGSLGDYIICGVNDPSQIAREDFRDNVDVVEAVCKEEMARSIGRNDDASAMSILKQASIICVYGMSFGLCDQRWWAAIVELMQNNPEVVLVIFSYAKGRLSSPIPYVRFAEMKKNIGQFLDAANVQDAELRASLAERIFVVPSELVFPITKAPDFTFDE